MDSHYIVTKRKATSQKISRFISLNEKEKLRRDGYTNYSAKVIEDVKRILIGGNFTFSR